jgi:hypothetical protein
VWLLDFCRCSNQKCCATPLRIMRQCCEAAMARVNTSLTVACAPRRSRREMRDDAVFDAARFARTGGFRRSRCVSIIDCDRTKPAGERAGRRRPARLLHAPWRGFLTPAIPEAFRKRRCPARLPQPAGLAFRAAKLSINAEIPAPETTTR